MKKLYGFGAALLLLWLLPLSAAGGFEAFAHTNPYTSGQFEDVLPNDWFAQSVADAYKMGLMQGISDVRFDPKGSITIAQAVAMSARLHSIYHGGDGSFAQTAPWYKAYVDYALEKGIIAGAYSDYSRSATRSEFAAILQGALPPQALSAINRIEAGAIPDVPSDAAYAGAVYTLYSAGVLTGNDAAGTFTPGEAISRSEGATILGRMANPALRRSLTLLPLSADPQAIYASCAPAIFYLETYDHAGRVKIGGSGFFIHPSGVAVTSYRLIQESFFALALTPDDQVHTVLGVLAYDAERDIALIQVEGRNFPTLTVGAAAAPGATVYAMGTVAGAGVTLSAGLVAHSGREGMLAYTASAAPTGGGVLLNTAGQVIGLIPAAGLDAAALYSAVPMAWITALPQGPLQTLSQIAAQEAARQYEARPSFGQVQVRETAAANSWEDATRLSMGQTLLGTLTGAEMNTYQVNCLTKGRLVITMATSAQAKDFSDLMLAAEDASQPGGYRIGTAGTLSGQKTLKATISVEGPATVRFALLSRELALHQAIYVEYAFYCVFIPDKGSLST